MKKLCGIVLAVCLILCCMVVLPAAAQSTKMIHIKGYCSRFAFRPRNVSLMPDERYRVSFYWENVNDADLQFNEGAD